MNILLKKQQSALLQDEEVKSQFVGIVGLKNVFEKLNILRDVCPKPEL
jgi:hypothetical protein